MSVMLTVSQLNAYVKSLVDGDINLSSVYICGEISNFTNHYRTGHLYFSLKDSGGAVKTVMFRSAAQRLKFEPANGMRVIVRGSISVYERDGVYQLYADDMQPDGVGALNLAYEQLKQRLEEKGYFDARHKKPIPEFPECIAVVTSPTGAAVQDIMNVLSRRFPYARVIIAPVQVQGDSAPGQIERAIKLINRRSCADVIIAGRGGGSIEDLWAFNDENVAMAIFNSKIPVISAVGHETDYTIADFVADLRAPTPSAAAELAVPDIRNLLSYIDGCLQSAQGSMADLLNAYALRLKALSASVAAHSPENTLLDFSGRLGTLNVRATAAMGKCISLWTDRLSSRCASLDALNPIKVLTRGYAIAEDISGKPITSVHSVCEGDRITVRLSDGSVSCVAERIN